MGSARARDIACQREHRAPGSILLRQVKRSAIRPVPCELEGNVRGKAVPGLIGSEDFVMQDASFEVASRPAMSPRAMHSMKVCMTCSGVLLSRSFWGATRDSTPDQ